MFFKKIKRTKSTEYPDRFFDSTRGYSVGDKHITIDNNGDIINVYRCIDNYPNYARWIAEYPKTGFLSFLKKKWKKRKIKGYIND